MARWQFLQTRDYYAKFYDVSPRTISRYAKDNYPLDDEAKTRALIAGQRSDGGNSQRGVDAPRTAAAGQGGALGLAAAMGRLQEAESAAYTDYQNAIADQNIALATTRKKDWLEISEQLRKAEKDSPEVEEANRKSVRLDQLSRALGGLFVKLRQDLDSLPNRVAIELIGKDEIAIREVLRHEAEAIVETLYDCEYLEGGAEDE